MLERKWDAVPPVALTTSGTSYGQITVTDTAGFRIKMTVGITTNVPNQIVPAQVKRIISSTVMILGQVDGKVFQWAPLDLSGFGPSNAAKVSAEQQDKSQVPPDPHYLATYEGDPVCADRIIFVDKYGNYYDNGNPLPIAFDGTIQVGDVAIVAHANPLYDQSPNTITSASLTPIYSYSSSNNATNITSLEVTISTPSLVQVILNGVVIRERWTSPMERTINFSFTEPRNIPNGQTLQVKAQVDRFLFSSYDTFVSLEGYVGSV